MRHLERHVLPVRQMAADKEADQNKERRAANPAARLDLSRAKFLDTWWMHWRRRADLMDELGKLPRYIAVTRTSTGQRMRVFTMIDSSVHPSDSVVAFTLADHYSFGVLQSLLHRTWFEARCTTLKVDPSYTSKTVFDTFPWPQSPTPKAAEAVADAARALIEHRTRATAEGRTLAQIYDVLRHPGKSTLRSLHVDLDAAVMDAYGFDPDVDVLAQLLSLNLTTAQRERDGDPVTGPGDARDN